MADFTLRQNDTTSSISSSLVDDDGLAVNITGASVNFRMADVSTGALKVDAAANIDDEATGQVSYDWLPTTVVDNVTIPGDTDTAGLFLAEWRVTYGNDAVESFPNTGYITIQITPELAATPTIYVTVEDVKDSLSLTGQNYADEDIRLAVSAASRAIDQACGRFFYSSTNETRYFTADQSDPVLFIDDLVTVGTVTVDSGNNGGFDTTWVKDTDFYLEPYNASLTGKPYDRIKIIPRSGRTFPNCDRNVKIVGTFGWPAVPPEVRQFAKIFSNKLLLRSRQAPFGVVSYGIDQPIAVQINRHDPDFERLLGHLVKVRMFL